jgi:hypothetical protein
VFQRFTTFTSVTLSLFVGTVILGKYWIILASFSLVLLFLLLK